MLKQVLMLTNTLVSFPLCHSEEPPLKQAHQTFSIQVPREVKRALRFLARVRAGAGGGGSEEMNGCSALTEREKEMRKSGESADTEGFIRKRPSTPHHGITSRGAKTKGKLNLKQNPNDLHAPFPFPKSSPTLLRFFSHFPFSDGKSTLARR